MALFSAEDGLERLPGLFEGGRLSPTQRRVARYVADHPREAPFLSSVELASRAGVSQPTVTRLAVALGYGGYGEFQRDLRRVGLGTAAGGGGAKCQAGAAAAGRARGTGGAWCSARRKGPGATSSRRRSTRR